MEGSGIRASDVMSREVVIAQPNMNLVEVARLMNNFRIGGLPVVERGRLIGAITERTIMQRVVEADVKGSAVLVKDIMTPPKVVINPEEDINNIAKYMSEHDVTRVFVCDKGKLIGIITNKDVLKHSHQLIDILVEQAKIKGPQLSEQYTAFGKCELCGQSTHLIFKDSVFACEACLPQVKKSAKKLFSLKMFK